MRIELTPAEVTKAVVTLRQRAQRLNNLADEMVDGNRPGAMSFRKEAGVYTDLACKVANSAGVL